MFRVITGVSARRTTIACGQPRLLNNARTVSTLPEGVSPDALKEIIFDQAKDFSKADRAVLEDAFGVPAEQLERKVSIYKPAKTATQHGWGVRNLTTELFSPSELKELGNEVF